MVFDVEVAMTWILFLALFPIAFYWLRRAWRILRHRDFSEVGIKRGVAPQHPEKFAPYALTINLLGGGIIVLAIVNVLTGRWAYETWSAVAGITIWGKLIADFILSRHAHPIFTAKKRVADRDVEAK